MKNLFIIFLLFVPSLALGNPAQTDGEISGVVGELINIANLLYQLVFVLIILAFAYGVLKFIFQDGDEKDKGKGFMVWSVVALFVLVSVWGIIQIVQGTLGIDGSETIRAPAIPTL